MIAHPSGFGSAEIGQFEKLVKAGGEVDLAGLSERILNAHLLGMALDGENVVSVAALKAPPVGRRKSVFYKAGADLDPVSFHLELGWVYTALEFRGRGHCTSLLAGLLSAETRNIFATARVGNGEIQRIMEKFAFKKIGQPYQGRTEPIQLFVRE